MTRFSTVMAVVAVAVLALGGLFLINRPNEGRVGTPSVSPSPSPVASDATPASAGVIPPELQYRWIGAPRDVGGRGMSSRTGLNFSQDGFFLSGTDYLTSGLLGSNASVTGPSEITLVTPDAGNSLCAGGDTGVYAYVLSPGGTMLNVSKVSDTCVPRATAVTGDWFRVACKSVDNACWGDLEAGTYPSQYVDPRLDPGQTWQVPFGALTFTVPDGWSNSTDWPSDLSLTPTADYAEWTADGSPDNVWHGVFLRARPGAWGRTATCADDPAAKDVARTPEALMQWITTRPGIAASEPQPMTIDGHPALWTDVATAADSSITCGGDADSIVPLLAEATGGDKGWDWAVAPTERQRLILVDLGEGDTVLIGIDTTQAERWEELRDQAMPIIESFRFK